ncbi:MAG TPA: PQQ-dependent sugar dehydrogenase, partial [Flavitalea sp.]|nr:PQQ-dependent sugar dehydrogenase [Flavitalea sp.]
MKSMLMFSISSFFPVALVAFAGVFCDKPVSNSGTTIPELPPVVIKTETIINKREIIWGMDFLPNGDLLFTEKKGTLTRAAKDSWTLTEITGLPTDIDPKGQGGLLDIKLHPKYSENGWIYANYVSTGGWLNLIRFKLDGNTINSIQNIFKSTTPDTWGGHFGGRIVFDNAGFLYLSIGEGGSGT